MNQVNLIGRLTCEVENRRTDTHRVVCRFTLAVDGYGKKENGKRDTYFFECEVWDDLGKKLWENLHKGDKVGISGYLKQYTFERIDGSKGSAVKIVVLSADYLSPKHEDQLPPKDEAPKEITDDDVPF